MDGVLLAIIALVVAGLASVLGIWMERDPTRPPRWAIGLSVLIAMATIVSLFQTITDAQSSAKMEADMARMLQTLDKMSSGSPELTAYLSKEMEAQSRSNPDVITKVAERVKAEGGDPNAMLARHLPAGELGNVAGNAAQSAAVAAQKAEAEKLRAELAAARRKQEAAEAEKLALDKKLEKRDKKMESAEKEIEELKVQLEKAQKRGGGATGGTRWGKG